MVGFRSSYFNPMGHWGGLIQPPRFLSGRNRKNYIDMVVFLLFYFSSRCAPVILVPFLWSYASQVQSYGPPKSEHDKKGQFWKNTKWPPLVIQLVWEKSLENKKVQSKLITHGMVQNFLTSDQNFRSYHHKTDFHVFGQKTFTEKFSNFKMATTKL